jgi:hypothetical protein
MAQASATADVFYKDFALAVYSDIVALEDAKLSIDGVLSELKIGFYPHIVKIIKKDTTFLTESPRILCGVALTPEIMTDDTWKKLNDCIVQSGIYLFKKRPDELFTTVKCVYNTMMAHTADAGADAPRQAEIDKILDDETAPSKFKDVLNFIMETRTCRLGLKLVENLAETLDMESELAVLFSQPNLLDEIKKGEENPTIKKLVGKIRLFMQEKMRNGVINQNQITADIEQIKAKVIQTFGEIFGLVAGEETKAKSQLLMGNSPEARRQRMIARMQTKQKKNSSM